MLEADIGDQGVALHQRKGKVHSYSLYQQPLQACPSVMCSQSEGMISLDGPQYVTQISKLGWNIPCRAPCIPGRDSQWHLRQAPVFTGSREKRRIIHVVILMLNVLQVDIHHLITFQCGCCPHFWFFLCYTQAYSPGLLGGHNHYYFGGGRCGDLIFTHV